jgi:hypothetical protein
MLIAAPIRELDQAKPIPVRVETHGLGVDGEVAFGQHARGQVFFVKKYGHIPAA